MRRARRSPAGGVASAVTLIGLALALTIHPFNLPIFFVTLALATFIGALGTSSPRRIYSAMYGSMWMLILALFFITYSWIWFLVGAAISALLGSLSRPIIAWLLTTGAFGLSAQTPPQQPYYTPPPGPQPQQPYQQGYQATPSPAPETYREGEKQYYYPPQSSEQYDSPQSQYPQQMPPQ